MNETETKKKIAKRFKVKQKSVADYQEVVVLSLKGIRRSIDYMFQNGITSSLIIKKYFVTFHEKDQTICQ